MAPPPTNTVTRPSSGSHYAPVLALSERAGSSIPVLLNGNSGHHGTGRRQGGADWALLGRYSLAHLSRPRIDPRRPLVPLPWCQTQMGKALVGCCQPITQMHLSLYFCFISSLSFCLRIHTIYVFELIGQRPLVGPNRRKHIFVLAVNQSLRCLKFTVISV